MLNPFFSVGRLWVGGAKGGSSIRHRLEELRNCGATQWPISRRVTGVAQRTGRALSGQFLSISAYDQPFHIVMHT